MCFILFYLLYYVLFQSPEKENILSSDITVLQFYSKLITVLI